MKAALRMRGMCQHLPRPTAVLDRMGLPSCRTCLVTDQRRLRSLRSLPLADGGWTVRRRSKHRAWRDWPARSPCANTRLSYDGSGRV